MSRHMKDLRMKIESQETLALLLLHMTHFVDIGAPAEAVMYYAADGAAHIRLPNGTRMHGRWEMTKGGYRVAWEDGPSSTWRFEHEPGRICYFDQDGKNHGPITRIIPGDVECLTALGAGQAAPNGPISIC